MMSAAHQTQWGQIKYVQVMLVKVSEWAISKYVSCLKAEYLNSDTVRCFRKLQCSFCVPELH